MVVLWLGFFAGGAPINILQLGLFSLISLGLVCAVPFLSRTFVFPYLFGGLYLLGYVFSFANVLQDVAGQDRAGFLTIGGFQFSQHEMGQVLAVVFFGVAGFLSAAFLMERFIGRKLASDFPLPPDIPSGMITAMAYAWCVLSFALFLFMWQADIGVHGMVTPYENRLPWRLEGILLYGRDYFLPLLGFALCEAFLRADRRRAFVGFLSLQLGLALMTAFASLSRMPIVFAAATAIFCVALNYKKLGLTPRRVLLFVVLAVFFGIFAISALTEIRNFLYVGHFTADFSSNLEVLSQPYIFAKLLAVRVEGIRQLFAVISSDVTGLHALVSVLSGSEAGTRHVVESVYGFVPHNKPGQAFGLTLGVWGLLYLSKNYAVVFIGTSIYTFLGMLAEYAFLRKGYRTAAFYVAFILSAIIWMNLTAFFLLRFFVAFSAAYFLVLIFMSGQTSSQLVSAAKSVLKRVDFIAKINAAVKAGFQERLSAHEEIAYRNILAERGESILAVSELEARLRARLSARGVVPVAKKRGDLHIFIVYGQNNWESVLPEALRGFGRVSIFEWRGRGFNDSSADWISEREEMNRKAAEAFAAARAESHVDAVVGYLSGRNADSRLIEQMAAGGAVIYNFCWDDKLYFKGPKLGGRHMGQVDIAAAVDLNLTNAPSSLVKYHAVGGLAMLWPEAASPQRHKPYDLPFEYEVSFVGKRYGWRGDFIVQLRRMGITVECFGDGWENGPLSDEDMVKLYSKSRINLGFSGVGHSKKLMCLKGRDFEVPMSGGLYLTQANPELDLVYKVGEEIVTYTDVADCAVKIRALLADPVLAAKIRAAGLARASREHTWDKRFETIFKLSGILS